MNKTYPALRGLGRLTCLPCLDREGKHAAMVVLSDGFLFLVVSGFDTFLDAFNRMSSALPGVLLGRAIQPGRAIYDRIHPWNHTPAEAEDLASEWRMSLSGLPFEFEVDPDIVYDRLNLDAQEGHLALRTPVGAAAALGCSRQNIHLRFKHKSLTPVFLDEPTPKRRHNPYCLNSEIMRETQP